MLDQAQAVDEMSEEILMKRLVASVLASSTRHGRIMKIARGANGQVRWPIPAAGH